MKKRIMALLCTIAMVFTIGFPPFATASAAAASAGPDTYGISYYLSSYDDSKKTDPVFINAIESSLTELRSQGLDGNSNAIQKAKLVHDYLAKTVSYDYTDYYANTVSLENASAYSALVKHTAVCEGYALAYRLLMNMLGVPTIMVSGTNHAWNMVNLNGKWYHVDVTWDDPKTTMNGVDIGETLRYDYFLKTDSFMKSLGDTSHNTWDLSLSNGYSGNLPTATDASYESYDFDNAQLSDLASMMPSAAATMSLDTSSTYNGTVGHGYTFAVNSNIGEMALASSTNPNVQVSAPVYASGKQYYTLMFKAPCTAAINVTSASGLKASFPVVVKAGKENFTCDTKGMVSMKANGTYTFMVTSNQTPRVATGNGLVDTIASRRSGNRYYYTIQAYGDPGTTVGIYINGLNIPAFIAKIV